MKRTLPLTLPALALVLLAAPALTAPRDASGTWEGRLMGLRLVLHVSATPGGSLSGTLDSPDQGATGLPIDAVSVRGDSLTLNLTALGARYDARFVTGGDSLSGTWSQGGASLPFGMRRAGASAAAPAAPSRPQTPRPPYPYDTLEVRLPGGAEGVTLAGTLTVPRARGMRPAALLISGSGPQDRDETLFGHRPFKLIADHLTRRGFVVLRVDDRGTAASTGRFAGATSDDFALDAAAAFEWLRQRGEVDSARVGLIGHSEGGLIAPMVAASDRRVAFVVLLAGPGVRGDSLMLRQGDDLRRALGVDSVASAQARRLNAAILGVLRTESDTTRIRPRVRAEVHALADGLLDAAALAQLDAQVEQQLRAMVSPWYRWFLSHDPRFSLRLTRCPVLALNGERDLQVAADENLPAIAAALHEGGNADVTIRALPGLNHLFQTCERGTLDEYARIEETFAPAALDTMTAWLEANVGARGGR